MSDNGDDDHAVSRNTNAGWRGEAEKRMEGRSVRRRGEGGNMRKD